MFFVAKYQKLDKNKKTQINYTNEFTAQNNLDNEDESKQVLIELHPIKDELSKRNSNVESKQQNQLLLSLSDEEIDFSIIEPNNDFKIFKLSKKIIFCLLFLILFLSIILLTIIFFTFSIVIEKEELKCSYQKYHKLNLTEIYYISDDIYTDLDPSDLLFSDQSKKLKQLKFSDEDEKNLIKFFTISDLHIDISYDINKECGKEGSSDYSSYNFSLGQYKCDPPIDLIYSMLRAMQKLDQEPDFVLFAGDIVRHKTPSENHYKKTIENFIKSFQKSFPNTIFLPILGNHDLFPHESYIEIKSGNENLDYISSQIGFSLPQSAFNTFKYGGYYSMMIPPTDRSDRSSSTLFIGLNNVIYTVDWMNNCRNEMSKSECEKERGIDPFGQFKWFRDQLSFARLNNYKVIMAMHFTIGRSRNGNIQWEDEFEQTFIEILYEFDDVITIILTGHSHRDFFRLLPNSLKHKISVMEVSGMTPIDEGNPTFRYHYFNSTSSRLVDYQQIYFDLSSFTKGKVDQNEAWKVEYTFTKQYGIKPTAEGFIHLYNQIASSNSNKNNDQDENYSQNFADDFKKYYTASSGKPPPSLCKILCSIVNIFNSESANCF